MTSDILASERDPRALKRAAVREASSNDAGAHARLFGHLHGASFLDRLDPPGDAPTPTRNLRLARVLRTLMDNPAPSADQILVQLTAADDYLRLPARRELLIRALRSVSPLPADAVAFLDRMSPEGGSLAYDVIETLTVNQSDPAMSLLRAKLMHPGHEHEAPEWLHYAVLPRRDDVALLKVLEAVLLAGVSAALADEIIATLFSYRPGSWYLECGPPEPPNRLQASDEAKTIIRRIGRHAVDHLALPADTRADVEAGLAALGGSGGSSDGMG